MIRRPPRSTLDRSSAASDVYKRQVQVIVSPPTVSRLANPQGYYLFNNLSPNTYLISLTIPDVSSINLPTRTVSLGEGLRSVVVNIPAVSYTHLRAHETVLDLVCRLLLEKKKDKNLIK